MARILACDDQPFMTRVVANWLKRYGHEVVCCCNGQEALAALRASKFDFLITDVDMPEMDGLALLRHDEVIAQLRAAVIVTGRNDYQVLGTDWATVVHVLPKPFSPTGLMDLINQSLGAEAQLSPCMLYEPIEEYREW